MPYDVLAIVTGGRRVPPFAGALTFGTTDDVTADLRALVADLLARDAASVVGGPRRLTSDARVARRLLDLVTSVPRPVWGRDELHAGEMWNSNSMIAWLIAMAGLPTDQLRPPPHGRAPGWHAGLEAARRSGVHERARVDAREDAVSRPGALASL